VIQIRAMKDVMKSTREIQKKITRHVSGCSVDVYAVPSPALPSIFGMD